MKQYCRYCVHLSVNNVPYCAKHNEINSRSSCIHPNNCKDYVFVDCEPEFQDAFGETNGYKPRQSKQRQSKQIEGQISIQDLT